MKKVAIVGFGCRDPDDIPFDDETYDIWGFNTLHGRFPIDEYRFTAWFQLHDRKAMEELHPRHVEWMQREAATFGLTIYMQTHHADIPTSESFPKKRVEELTLHGEYQASSISWILGFAIAEGYEHIELMGQNFTYGEPPAARACVEYWIGVAEGMGANVYVNDSSDLLQNLDLLPSSRQYGYEPMAVPGRVIHGL